MPAIKITLDENDIRNAVKQYVERVYKMTLTPEVLLTIEWENPTFRAILESK